MKEESQAVLKRLASVLDHIERVRSNAMTLAEALIDQGKDDLAVTLMHNVLAHDQSKLTGIEWEHLSNPDASDALLSLAIAHHNQTNSHHPEHWGHISKMPPVYLAEAVCDWKARSSEFGTSLHEWIDDEATKRFGFTAKDRVYRDIRRYVKLLLGPGFRKL